jgi:uncharacterized membrane protein YdjX (TVP38/TMEM64 family)
MSERKKKNIQIAVLIAVALLVVLGTVRATLWVLELRDPNKLAAFQELIGSMGLWGYLVLLAIQYVQIVVAFIPGGPIQLAAGALCGPELGLLICVGGTVLAEATVFALVSRFGTSVISLFVDAKDIKQYKFLQNERKLESLVMILFFIPGTPKDALTYLFALTPIPMARFMVLSVVARLPAVATSIFAGDSISNGEWMRAAILFASISAIALAGLLLHKKILSKYGRKA